MRRTLGAAVLGLACAVAVAARPLPPPRPADLAAPPHAVPEPAESVAPPTPSSCLARLRAAGHEAESATQATPIQPGCAIDEPVRLRAVSAGPDRRVTLPEAPMVSCALAEPLAGWIGRVVAPVLAQRAGSPLAAIRTGPGFECRTRNRQPGAKLSAHARGRAIDVSGFELAGGRALPVLGMPRTGSAPDAAAEPAGTLQALRISACGWFTTVLGPGSDGFHEDHLHLDMEQRGAGGSYRICQ